MFFTPHHYQTLRYKIKVPCGPALMQLVPGKPRIAGCFGVWLIVPDDTVYEDLTRYFEVVGWGRARPQTNQGKAALLVIKGSKGSAYTVRRAENGRTTCTCPGFSYRGACKHTKLLPA